MKTTKKIDITIEKTHKALVVRKPLIAAQAGARCTEEVVFEYRGTSGFMITVDMKSKDFAYPQL